MRSVVARSLLVAMCGAVACHSVSGLSDFTTRPLGGSGGAGSGGAGGAGGVVLPPDLVGDDSLVARYFLDDKVAGDPEVLVDAGPDGHDLAVFGTGNMQHTQDEAGHVGLTWMLVAENGRGERVGVVDALHQTHTATIEVVMALTGDQNAPRLFHVGGDNDDGLFALVRRAGGISLRLDGNDVASWSYDTTARHVTHVRIDLAHADADERAVLFVDGERGPVATVTAADLMLNTPTGTWFVLGNRRSGNRSPQGTMFYFALYSAALSDTDIAHNAGELLERDDFGEP